MRCLKEMATVASAPSQRSEMARTKYWGGRGSNMGMVKTSSCGSPERTWSMEEGEREWAREREGEGRREGGRGGREGREGGREGGRREGGRGERLGQRKEERFRGRRDVPTCPLTTPNNAHLFLLQQEVLRVVHCVVLCILHPQPPRLPRGAVQSVVPLELWCDGQTNTEYCTSDGLDGCR